MQRWRVPLGFACAALFFLLAQARPGTLIVGGLVALPALALRAMQAGSPRSQGCPTRPIGSLAGALATRNLDVAELPPRAS